MTFAYLCTDIKHFPFHFQDWDFPHFVNNFDVKLPGLNIAHLKFQIPNCAKHYSDTWYVHISGKCNSHPFHLIFMQIRELADSFIRP